MYYQTLNLKAILLKGISSLILFSIMISCNDSDKNPLYRVIAQNEWLNSIAENPKYEVQIIYSQINRNSDNTPTFNTFSYNTDTNQYFYPASTVKMPIALLALEKLNELSIRGLDKYTTMITDSAFSGQSPVLTDSTSESGLPSIAHYIKKIFVASDNDAYNRLYEFLGQEYINDKLKEKGYKDTQIIHRLSIPLSIEENKHTNPIKFLAGDSIIYEQPLVKSNMNLNLNKKIVKGVGYIDQEDRLVKKPFEFTYKNTFALEDLHSMLKTIIFRDSVNGFNITDNDYAFVLKYMSQLPKETRHPNYAAENLPDGYCKFLMFSNQQTIPSNIRIFNKIGQAYGYMIDNAYIVDLENNIEFLLSAVISVNENQLYNDGNYEYETIGDSFMQDLGQLIYNYEKDRERDIIPNLATFNIVYDSIK